MIERKTIKEVLMERDNYTAEEADRLIQDAQNEFDDLIAAGDMMAAEEICADYFGLEPDYLDEFSFLFYRLNKKER